MMQKRWLTNGDMADLCGVNVQTVNRWIDRGELKASHLPGRGDKRIDVQDASVFMKRQGFAVPSELQGNNPRVLIVDDDESMAGAIQRALKQAGFETVIATDGFLAGTLLGTFNPTVITLDLQMETLSGIEVLKYIRNVKQSSIRILVVSAMPKVSLQKALEAGADDILEKPFKNQELLDKIKELSGTLL